MLATHPSLRHPDHAHELLTDYRNWRLLLHVKTRSKHPRQGHHHQHHHLQTIGIIIIVPGGL